MRKSKEFISMPVISLEEGRQIGTIKSLVVNPAEKKVVALAIEQKGLFKEQRFIPYTKIRSIGEDAVTVSRSSVLQKGASLPEIAGLVKDKININGTRIVSESGTLLGVVDDYYVNLSSGELVGMEFSSNYINGLFNGKAFLDADIVLTIGKEMIVCSDKAQDKVVKMDGGLQEKLRGVKKSTGQWWESTVQKTRELGSRLKRSKNGEETEAPPDEAAHK